MQTSAHVFITGRVQGVFFRLETQRAAQELGLYGWVRNLADGRVEALFGGHQNTIEKMIEWCRQGPPRADVTHVEIEWQNMPKEIGKAFQVHY